MVAGSLIVSASLLLLGFTREFVGLFLDGEVAAKATVWLAVLAIWVIDFAINACGLGPGVCQPYARELTVSSHVLFEKSRC